MKDKTSRANVPPPQRMRFLGNIEAPVRAAANMSETKLADMNFKVDPELHRKFKMAAAANSMTMREVLEAAFDLWLRSRDSERTK